MSKKKSLATLKKTQEEIDEIERFIKADGYDDRTHFFDKVVENYLAHKRADRKLVYPVRFMTRKEEDFLAEKKPKKRPKR